MMWTFVSESPWYAEEYRCGQFMRVWDRTVEGVRVYRCSENGKTRFWAGIAYQGKVYVFPTRTRLIGAIRGNPDVYTETVEWPE